MSNYPPIIHYDKMLEIYNIYLKKETSDRDVFCSKVLSEFPELEPREVILIWQAFDMADDMFLRTIRPSWKGNPPTPEEEFNP